MICRASARVGPELKSFSGLLNAKCTMMDVLVIDIGVSSVKLWHTGHEEHRKFASGASLTPERTIEKTKEMVAGWQWEAIALGLPCRVSMGRAVEDPQNLGPGWMGYNFSS